MYEERRVYCKYCEQTFLTDDLDKCSLCRKTGGLLDPMSPTALTDMVTKKREQTDPADQLRQGLATGVGVTLLLWRLIRLIAAGAVCIALGVFLIFNTDLRANPRQWSLTDALPGLGATFVGLVLLLFAYLMWRVAKEDAMARATEKGGQPVEKDNGSGVISDP